MTKADPTTHTEQMQPRARRAGEPRRAHRCYTEGVGKARLCDPDEYDRAREDSARQARLARARSALASAESRTSERRSSSRRRES